MAVWTLKKTGRVRLRSTGWFRWSRKLVFQVQWVLRDEHGEARNYEWKDAQTEDLANPLIAEVFKNANSV